MIGRPDAELAAAVEAAQGGDPHRLTRADLLLSQAYAAYVRAHYRAPATNAMRYIDTGLAPAPNNPTLSALTECATAGSLLYHYAQLRLGHSGEGERPLVQQIEQFVGGAPFS